ncbi:MAG: sulfotransferase domain-containing protein [Candidatus Scalindua sp.]|nr:sulfotransferase domain-containing protein [Candidatus Scalindua sp.]
MIDEMITIVSGLPRSGTSMMVKMLEAGGMDVLTDRIRKADEFNPNGYYEYEKVKEIAQDASWLKEAKGKGVKIITALLQHLPEKYTYKIILMHRNMNEILNSQKRMLIGRKQPTGQISDENMKMVFHNHLEKVVGWIGTQSNMKILHIHYNEVLKEPAKHIKMVNQFLMKTLNTNDMISVVDEDLYRNQVALDSKLCQRNN